MDEDENPLLEGEAGGGGNVSYSAVEVTRNSRISVFQDENPPLESFNLLARSVGTGEHKGGMQASGETQRTLDTFFGVFMPCVLSMFSLVLFLRSGIAVGEGGLFIAIAMLSLGYFIIAMTILSVCAVSTNGNVQGGGAYFMISRALGPEFGGALGILFFIGNVFSCASYVISIVEALQDSFGKDSGTLAEFLPTDYLYQMLMCTAVLIFCFGIVIVGASIYAKSTFFIFIVVNSVIVCVFISFFVENSPIDVDLPKDSVSMYNVTTALYTGLNRSVFQSNLDPHYSKDYTTKEQFSFVKVFAIVFNGCTGIMAGANLSGELKNPAKAIPRGTILATCYTYIIYMLIYFFSALTCTTDLLQRNYTFLQPINFCPPIVLVGTVLVTTSAALSTLIGASRVLFAVAKDDILGVVLRPVKRKVTQSGNPWLAVLVSFVLVQCVLFIGQVNELAPLISIFYLLVYFSINLSCAALDVASAPNFRPQFKYFSWHTCALGMLGSLVMMILISPVYASISFLAMLFLIVLISFIGPDTSWGSISQALLFYVVRKFLLKLDQRKDHVKFWRPQILLLAKDPQKSAPLLHFANDIKKSGLYVIGHVASTNWESLGQDPTPELVSRWLTIKDYMKLKAFVEVSLNSSIRDGILNLTRISGLGGMKPNTVMLGFCHDDSSVDRNNGTVDVDFTDKLKQAGFAARDTIGSSRKRTQVTTVINNFVSTSAADKPKCQFSPHDYVSVIDDLFLMQKNVCVARHFHRFEKNALLKSASTKEKRFIDVWLSNFYNPVGSLSLDKSGLFQLQLACVLSMQVDWRKYSKLRVLMTIGEDEPEEVEAKLRDLLSQLRIQAEILLVPWQPDTATFTLHPSGINRDSITQTATFSPEYFQSCNSVILDNSRDSLVTFLHLPKPQLQSRASGSSSDSAERYLSELRALTEGLPPCILVHGVSAVTCTGL